MSRCEKKAASLPIRSQSADIMNAKKTETKGITQSGKASKVIIR
jgi:hypothetical protein